MNLLHGPCKGGSQIMPDLLGGHIQVGGTSVLTVLQHYKSGKLKVPGVAGKSRWPSMPAVPTVVVAGLPGYENSAWYGLFGPPGLSPEVARRIQGGFARIVKLPDVAERLPSLGAIASASTPDEFAAFARAEHAKYGKLVKDAGYSLSRTIENGLGGEHPGMASVVEAVRDQLEASGEYVVKANISLVGSLFSKVRSLPESIRLIAMAGKARTLSSTERVTRRGSRAITTWCLTRSFGPC